MTEERQTSDDIIMDRDKWPDHNTIGLESDLHELIRVALTNPGDLHGFIKANYPKEYDEFMGAAPLETSGGKTTSQEVEEAACAAMWEKHRKHCADDLAYTVMPTWNDWPESLTKDEWREKVRAAISAISWS